MKKILLTLMLAAASAAFGQFSVGVQIGAPPPPRVIRVRPPAPGPDFVWVDGYWYPVGNRYRWHDGYWTRPYYPGAAWVAPRHDGERYYEGYWEGDRGHFRHEHDWDKDRGRRDWDREHDRNREHDRDRDRQ